jgi:phage-related minor tail protein
MAEHRTPEKRSRGEENREMATRQASEKVSPEFDAIQQQVAQLRSNLRELGQALLAWGQHEVGDARNSLQAKAQDLGESLSDTVEAAQKRGSTAVKAFGNQPKASPGAATLPKISAGIGVLLLLVSGVSWATKRLSR